MVQQTEKSARVAAIALTTLVMSMMALNSSKNYMKTTYIKGFYTLRIKLHGVEVTFLKLKLTAKEAEEAFKTQKMNGIYYEELTLNKI